MVNLVNVVSREISKVLKNRQISMIEFTCDNGTIQLEIAAKVNKMAYITINLTMNIRLCWFSDRYVDRKHSKRNRRQNARK